MQLLLYQSCPCPSAAASDHDLDGEAADGMRDLLRVTSCSRLRLPPRCWPCLPPRQIPIVSEDMAIDSSVSESHGCTAAAATLQDDEAGPAVPAEAAASAPHCANLTMAMLSVSAAAALRRDDSELTPYQHTASPAALVQPAAVTVVQLSGRRVAVQQAVPLLLADPTLHALRSSSPCLALCSQLVAALLAPACPASCGSAPARCTL